MPAYPRCYLPWQVGSIVLNSHPNSIAINSLTTAPELCMEVQQRPPLPRPGTAEFEELPQYVEKPPLPFRRTNRRQELLQIVPLAETNIYELERRGEFPRRFNLTPRCVVWDLEEEIGRAEERRVGEECRSGRVR